MGDLLLLKNKHQCPKCRYDTAPQYLPGQCRACGMQLFDYTNDLQKFEDETGWREYWVWHRDKGWMHRTQIFNERALEREIVEDVVEEDYGTEAYINRKIDNSRIELKQALAKGKKKATFKKVYK